MVDTPRSAKTGKRNQTATPTRTRLIVRRGADRRHAALTKKTADLAVDVLWDRREADRRAAADSIEEERRTGDRRKKPPFTWEVADFAVVVDPDPTEGDGT